MAEEKSVDIERVGDISESYNYYTGLREQRAGLISEISMLEMMINKNYQRIGIDKTIDAGEKPNGSIIPFTEILEDEIILKNEIDRLNKDITKLEKKRGELRSERDKLADKVDELVRIDGLTGLYNKKEAYRRLMDEISRAERDGQCIAVVMMDIDHFKIYNDSYGHQQGDKALEKMGEILKTRIRVEDSAQRIEGKYDRNSFRYGGEEFMLILTNVNEEGAKKGVERIRNSVEQENIPVGLIEAPKKHYKFMTGRDVSHMTASFGYVVYGIDEPYRNTCEDLLAKAEKLIGMADQALYKAKEKRNIVCRYKHGQA